MFLGFAKTIELARTGKSWKKNVDDLIIRGWTAKSMASNEAVYGRRWDGNVSVSGIRRGETSHDA